eukprot:Tamp_03129.p1 GENE.Tamp_03129~~Tamp_03129.p1  ORF type:complete len:518 (+),score=97.68 Tamp_03129:2063-3616(+)
MGDYDEDDFEDYDEDFEEDESEPSPKKADSPKAPPPKPSAPPQLPQNAKSPQRTSAARQSAAIDPKVLEMQRAMAKENEAAAAGGGKGGSQRAANRHAPMRQSQAQASVRQSQSGASIASEVRLSKDSAKEDKKPPPPRKQMQLSMSTGSPKAGGKSALNKSDGMALAKRMRARHHELIQSGKVKLSYTNTQVLLDASPMTPYELYARGFSRQSKETSSAQCPDDHPHGEVLRLIYGTGPGEERVLLDRLPVRVSEDSVKECIAQFVEKNPHITVSQRRALPKRQLATQTDEVTRAHAAMQCPEDLATRSKHEKEKQREMAKKNVHNSEPANLIGQDASRLAPFLLQVEPVVTRLLTENSNAAMKKKDPLTAFGQHMKNPKTTFSSTSQALTSATCGKLLKKRPIKHVAFGGLADEFLGVAYHAVEALDEHGVLKDPPPGLASMGLICVWKVPDEPAEPKYRMAAHVSPTAHVLVSVGNETLCIVGTAEGTLCLWDLRAGNESNSFVVPMPAKVPEV